MKWSWVYFDSFFCVMFGIFAVDAGTQGDTTWFALDTVLCCGFWSLLWNDLDNLKKRKAGKDGGKQ